MLNMDEKFPAEFLIGVLCMYVRMLVCVEMFRYLKNQKWTTLKKLCYITYAIHVVYFCSWLVQISVLF